jgi:hypothetical protein
MTKTFKQSAYDYILRQIITQDDLLKWVEHEIAYYTSKEHPYRLWEYTEEVLKLLIIMQDELK